MLSKIEFTLEASGSDRCRAGYFFLDKHRIETPVFMPVGTQASIKAFDHSFLSRIGYNLILANTYHLVLRPGLKIIAELGGVKKFMNLDAALLTDSGGFQAFSLSPLVKFKEDGIEFRSHIDGSLHFFSPENVLDAQSIFGSDISMLLDHVVPFGAERSAYKDALLRTSRWAQRSKQALLNARGNDFAANSKGHAFAIMQGGFFADLRRESAQQLVDLDFPGYAIGGLSVGEDRQTYSDMTYLSADLLPHDRPRYIMGVGTIQDLLIAIDAGIDMFDCVLPTRNARNGSFMTSEGAKNIRNSRYKNDPNAIDPHCHCHICHRYSAAYLHHLFRSKEILAAMAATEHNLFFMRQFVSLARQAICQSSFASFKNHWLHHYPLNRGSRASEPSA